MEEAYVLPIDVTCKYDVSSQMQSGFIDIPWEDMFSRTWSLIHIAVILQTHHVHVLTLMSLCIHTIYFYLPW